MEGKPELTLVFRDKRHGNHSIERLFATLEPYFSDDYEVRKVVVPMQPSGLRALWTNIRYARKHTRDLVHVTGDAQYLIPFLPRGLRILTIHDCGYLEKLKGWKKLLYRWIWFTLPCRFASVITVISTSTKEVLERELGEMGRKLVVIENCITLEMQKSSRTFNSKRPRILQIGSGQHKNLDTLIKAVEGLDCEVHIVGKLSEVNRQALEAKNIEYVNEFAVSDERMEEIYHSCDILFFASRHEGFGLPILEGNAVGIPVITSNCYSMPQVAGNGAIIVNPESKRAVRDAIVQLCGDEEYRGSLIRNGFKNLERYSPENCSQKYLDIYDQLSRK